MRKGLKITLIVLSFLVGIIALDTLQAKIFDNSPILKIRNNLDDGSTDYVDKGIFVNYYHCSNNEKVTTWKGTKFTCSVKESKKDEFDFYLTKLENQNTIKFKNYYTTYDRTIFLASNIDEFYVKDLDANITLKTYLSTTFQTLTDGIKHITDKLEKVNIYRDGGTTVYKSKDKDITLITCNKINGSKNIYIGDYQIEYTDDICE